MSNSGGMTAEQLAALRSSMFSNESSNKSDSVDVGDISSPTPSTNVNINTMQTEQTGRPMTQSEMLRNRMKSGSQQSSDSVKLVQGDSYKPQEDKTPEPTPTPTAKTTTIINTPKTDDNDSLVEDKKFKITKPIAMVIVGVIIVLLILCVMFFGKGKEGSNDTTVDEGLVSDEELEWITPDYTFSFTQEEIESLREVGYTGDEIESFASLGFSAADMVLEAEVKRDAWIQEAIAPLYDSTSEEYKNFINQTWLTLPERNDTDEWSEIAGYYEERKNLDYEKVTVYGNQLFLKVFLDDDTHQDWFFLNVTPEEWNKLNDRGNVIVTYTYCTRYVGVDSFTMVEDFDNVFITAATLEIIE